jgi:hypothetical protein
MAVQMTPDNPDNTGQVSDKNPDGHGHPLKGCPLSRMSVFIPSC